jgi:hypothetical protein
VLKLIIELVDPKSKTIFILILLIKPSILIIFDLLVETELNPNVDIMLTTTLFKDLIALLQILA